MKKYSSILALLCLLFISATSQAQADSTKEKIQFKLGVYHSSTLHYYGRTDSLKSSGVFPVAETWFSKNFYINAAPVFINNSVTQFDYAGTVATAGYLFKEDNWGGNIYFVKPFYKNSSELVQSALKGQAVASFTNSSKILNVTAGGDIKFSDKIDYGATAGLDHLARFEPGNGFVVVLNPSAYINAGTQQFTKTYYQKSSFLLFPGSTQQVNENVKAFNILSYEFSMPVVVAKGKVQFIANPAYVMPQNLIKVEGRPDLSERGENLFYITLGAKYSF